MFEESVRDWDGRQIVASFRTSLRREILEQNRQLILAAAWADHHPGDRLPRAGSLPVRLVGERGDTLGGDGTPLVAEFAPAALAPEVGVSVPQARALIADALDLRHRYPLIWQTIDAGTTRAWAARTIARFTRHLSLQQAGVIDQMLAHRLNRIGRRRLDNLLDAAILRVDPAGVAERIRKARRARHVTFGQSNEDGTKTLAARLDTPDAIWLDAMIKRVATILRTAPAPIPGIPTRDAKTADEWEAVALGVLANPLRAAQLLIEHEQPDLFDLLTDEHATATGHQPPSNKPEPASEAEPPQEELITVARQGSEPVGGAEPEPVYAPDLDSGLEPDCTPEAHYELDPGCAAGPACAADPAYAAEPEVDDLADDGPVLGDGTAPDPDRSVGAADRYRPVVQADDPAAPSGGSPFVPPANPSGRQQALRLLLKHLDPVKLLPPVTLYVHCSAADVPVTSDPSAVTDLPAERDAAGQTALSIGRVARIEDLGPVLEDQVRDWFGGCTAITLKPVIDPAGITPVDQYEVPDHLREALHLRHPASVFPYTSTLGRRMDIDHTIPYRPGLPGQTGMHNNGPLSRSEHRFKTHGSIGVRQPEPGVFVWRTRYGRVIITDHTGTHDLGAGALAHAVWTTIRDTGRVPAD